jgi:uncharacterized membrane protein
MPPIHPALVHFPIALVTLAVVADLVGKWRDSRLWAAAAFGSLIGAVIGAAAAIAAGYYDMGRAALGETHEYVHVHMTVGWILSGVVVALTVWRWRIFRRPQPHIPPSYLLAAFLALAVTWFQGWYGGELVFSQGAGVAAAGKGTEPADAGEKRLEGVSRKLGAEPHGQEEHRERAHY